MSKAYENKSIHNKTFLDSIHNDYPDEYFDWKVTVQFYVALHKCYCVLETQNIDVEPKHMNNISNLKTVNNDLGRKLFILYRNSRQSRYEGFMTQDAMDRINKIKFEEGNRLLPSIDTLTLKYYPIPA